MAIPIAKLRSMRFVKQMFLDRGYQVDDAHLSIVFDKYQDIWIMRTVSDKNEPVAAIFADCKSFGTLQQSSHISMSDIDLQYKVIGTADRDLALPSSNNKNTGTDYIKCIIKFATEQKIKIVILVTDFMTPQASKLMKSEGNVRMTHFTYDETGIEHMADHITQPVKFQALVGDVRKTFIAKNPRYELELLRYSFDDALVKYYGMTLGDIIHIQDNDRQSGLVEEYGLVVEEIS